MASRAPETSTIRNSVLPACSLRVFTSANPAALGDGVGLVGDSAFAGGAGGADDDADLPV